jgi:hypothetical protein
MLSRVLLAPVAIAQGRRIKSMVPLPFPRTARVARPISAHVGVALCSAFITMLAAPQAMGQLVHRYSFTANANDSVGSAHGTVIDAGTTANFAFTGGQLDLSANTGNASNAITEDAYVDLPNGIVSAAATGGMNGAVAFEWWFTVSENRTWQRLGDFGISNGGEGMSPAGSASPYLSIVTTSGRGNIVDMTNHPSTGQEPAAGFNGTPAIGQPYHVMAVYNHNDPRAFTADGANGTMTIYLNDGVTPRVAYGAIHPNINIRTLTDVNNWLGRSQWPDPLFDGMYDEFRIYNSAPSAAYVASSFAAGPGVVPTFQPWTQEFNFSFEVDRDTGVFTLKNTGPSVNVVGINIASASGALDPTKWKSVSGNYDLGGTATFDPDGSWAVTSTTATQLTEVESSGNGGQLGTGGTAASLQLGLADAWTLSRHEDLVVSITRLLPDNFTTETIGVPVTYLNGLGQAAARSDLTFDGAINAADWVEFASHHFNDFTGMTVAQAAVLGDLDGNLANNYDDFLLFQADYDAANGVGALVALISAVPEPSSVALLLIAGGAALSTRRRKSSRRTGRVLRVLLPSLILCLAGLQTSVAQIPVYENDYQAEAIGGGVPGAWNWGGGQITTHNAVFADYAGNTVVEHTGIVLGAGVDTRFGSKWDLTLAGNTSSDPAQYTISFDLRNVSGNWNPLPLELFVLTANVAGTNDAGFGSGAIQVPQGNDWVHVEYNLADLNVNWWQGQDWVLTKPRWSLEVGMPWPGLAPTEAFNQVWLMDNLKIELQPPPAVGLTLVVNTTTEEVKIRNTTANPLSFDYYAIDSPQGALDTAGWNGLKDKGIDAGPAADFSGNNMVDAADLVAWKGDFGVDAGSDANGDGQTDGSDFLAWQRGLGSSGTAADGWIEAGGSSASKIGELRLNGATTLAPGAEISLGLAYNNAIGDSTIVFNVSSGESTALGLGSVVYVTGAASAVPEPASAVMVLVAVCFLRGRRRRAS